MVKERYYDDCDSPQRHGRKPRQSQESLRIRGRRYDVLDHLGHGHRPRLLLLDRATRQQRIGLILPANSATAQHVQVLKRLPQLSGLPKILDYERQSDQIILVLERISGIDLGQYLDRVRRKKVVAPCPYEAVRLIFRLACALAQLHRYALIIHGDLKPENLILTRKPSQLVMIDFGSAWKIEQTVTRQAGDGLSLVYAAPELQTQSQQIDFRADQFSVSVILYQLLTGTIPYSGLGGQAGRPGYQEEFSTSLPSPSELSPAVQRLPTGLCRAVDALVQTGLEIDADARYPTSAAWLDALEQLHFSLRMHQKQPGSYRTRWQQLLDTFLDRLSVKERP